MLTRYLPNPTVPGTCVHNTAYWQVTEYLGGLACELLKKERVVDSLDRASLGLPLHECYPSVFFQGDEATEFLATLHDAQENLASSDIDRLLLSAYDTVVS